MTLFPAAEPFDSLLLPVTDGHTLAVSQYGNPAGLPVIVLHGGPGGGCKPAHAQIFDPTIYRVILFDQRGCGASRWPGMSLHGRIQANTTQHLVADVDAIRRHFGLTQWLVYGYSWGSTLGLAYCQQHPENVLGFITGGILLGTDGELEWFSRPDGIARFHPQPYARLISMLPPVNGPLEPATRARQALEIMTGSDARKSAELVHAWTHFEMFAATPQPNEAEMNAALNDIAWLLPHSLLECHYHAHRWFLEEGQLLANVGRLKDIPVHIIQGALDMVCPPIAAHALHQALQAVGAPVTLEMISMTGHVSNDAMVAARVAATNAMAQRLLG